MPGHTVSSAFLADALAALKPSPHPPHNVRIRVVRRDGSSCDGDLNMVTPETISLLDATTRSMQEIPLADVRGVYASEGILWRAYVMTLPFAALFMGTIWVYVQLRGTSHMQREMLALVAVCGLVGVIGMTPILKSTRVRAWVRRWRIIFGSE